MIGDTSMSAALPATPLAGRVALVTGGGSGIGRATALAFAAAGAAVMAADIDPVGGEETVQLVQEQGGTANFVRADVTVSADVAAMVAATVARFGRLDCAFNNAGIAGVIASLADYPEEVFDRVLAVNLKGVWLCMRHEIPVMLEQGGGAIVNMASVSGLKGSADVSAYVASKHGVVGLTKSAALGYAARNIRVNAVCPCIIDTPLVAGVFDATFTRERANAAQPIGRMGRAEEVAPAVVWLCSDAAALVTGAAMPVDGAYLA
jgi:NAD(P)-dependent dehydrogenase (short-subunit alcohol dehydrogenase family)